MRFIPSGVRGSMGESCPTPNMMTRQMTVCTKYMRFGFLGAADTVLVFAAMVYFSWWGTEY